MSIGRSLNEGLKDTSLARKLAGVFALVAVSLLVALVVGWSSIGSVSQTVKRGYAAALTAEAASGAAYNMHVSQIQDVLDGGAVAAMHSSDVATYTATIAALRPQLTTAHEKAGLRAAEAGFARWLALDEQIADLTRAGNLAAATKLANGSANAASDALSAQLTALANDASKNADASSSAARSSARLLMLALAVIGLSLGCALVSVIVRQLACDAREIIDRTPRSTGRSEPS